MNSQPSVSQFGRWSRTFPRVSGVEQVRFLTPSGKTELRPTFDHLPAIFQYDLHGYEEMLPSGEIVKMARYTPQEAGTYHYQAESADQIIEEGSFACLSSDNPGYVTVSKKDPRYFAFSRGDSFCPIGLNLCMPAVYALPQGMDHFAVGNRQASLGLHEYRRWFRLLAENGGNFTRIWLSSAYLQVEGEQAGQVDPLIFNRMDGIVELAREYGIRLKLCFDHFRAFNSSNPVTQAAFLRTLVDPQNGQKPRDMDDWMTDPRWQELWFKKVKAYLARYGGDPVVMAWELWNEMDCIQTDHWELVREWTRTMLVRIREMEPTQLVVNSLGSFDEERKQIVQDDMKMDETDFQQVHRYLDQGAPLEICTVDPIAFSIDAVQRCRRPNRPVLLAETGAVNDRHTGPFRFMRMDNRGIIFHDTTFPAFFAGGAGTGQDWFWDSYADQKNVWQQFKPFADLIQGVTLDDEAFQGVDLSNDLAWCLALQGKHTWLIWVRNRADSWHAVLRDEIQPPVLGDLTFDLTSSSPAHPQITLFPAWPEDKEMQATVTDRKLVINHLRYGCMIRLKF